MPGLTPATGQDLWKNVHNCPFLVLSAIKENQLARGQ